MIDKIKVLIADDHSVVRMGLASLLGTAGNIELVGEAADGADAVRKTKALHPDVVVMDLVMPIKNGIEATREIVATVPEARVLILTTFGSSDDISRALEAGASGAIMKSATNRELLSAVQSVVMGQRVISDEVAGVLSNSPQLPDLSNRQREILEAMVQGKINKEIAAQLNISLESVKSHIKVLLAKLGAGSRTEAVAIALKKQLVKT